jgi:hypothetical protein
MRYHNLRQGEKEYISKFKIRFDHQVKSNKGAGMPDISERLRAMDFIGKLDFKRYNGMLTSMRNCSCLNLPGSYPKTLSAAHRTASTWTRDGLLVPLGGDSHSAFLAGTAFVVTKGKDSNTAWPGEKKEKDRLQCLRTNIATSAARRGIFPETAVCGNPLYPTQLSWFQTWIQTRMMLATTSF